MNSAHTAKFLVLAKALNKNMEYLIHNPSRKYVNENSSSASLNSAMSIWKQGAKFM